MDTFRILRTSFRICQRCLLHARTQTLIPTLGYKSQYSLSTLYPASNHDFLSNLDYSKICHPSLTSQGLMKFSGYIPLDKLEIKHMKGSGPGGQNVNKVNTKVEVRFHVESAEWIPSWIIPTLLQKEKGRINKDGYMIVTSDKTRKQILNQADCLEKIRTIIHGCGQIPNAPTQEDIELKENRVASAKRVVLREKKENSLKKQNRQKPTMDGV